MIRIKPIRYSVYILPVLITITTFMTFSFQKSIKPLKSIVKDRRKIPNMWVDKGTSNRMEGNFNLQHFQLSQYIKADETDSIFYSKEVFYKVMDFLNKNPYKYLHVNIASYDAGPHVPTGYVGKLTLLFNTAIDCSYDHYPFYSITPSGFFDPTSDSCAIQDDKWIKAYTDDKMPNVLSRNIYYTDPNNHTRDGLFSDTRRISYKYKDITDLIAEIHYQEDTNHIEVSGLRAFFASYSSSGNPKNKNFANRIYVLFEFTTKGSKNQDSVFYIDDQPNFIHRKDQDGDITAENDCENKGNDNGHLCPPNCP
jgi:hypothetical protein